MDSFVDKLGSGNFVGVVAITGGILFLVAIVALDFWQKVRRAEADAAICLKTLELKLEMVDRGMSADDITRVLAAGYDEIEPAPARRSGRG